MDGFGAVAASEGHDDEGKDEADAIVGGETKTGPSHTFAEEFALFVGAVGQSAVEMHADADREINPHGEESEPGEELDGGQLTHDRRHGGDAGKDGFHAAPEALGFLLLAEERFDILWRVFRCRQDGDENGEEERAGADIKGESDRGGDVSLGGFHRHAEVVAEDPRQGRGDDGAESDEQTLHGEALFALLLGKFIGHEGAERLHRYIDRGIEDPEQADGHPKDRRVGHGDQGGRGDERADQEIRAAPPHTIPRAIAEVADDGLDDETGQRCGDPEEGKLLGFGSEEGVDGRHVGHLQTPAELDSEEPEGHVPDLPEGEVRFLHGGVWEAGGLNKKPVPGKCHPRHRHQPAKRLPMSE